MFKNLEEKIKKLVKNIERLSILNTLDRLGQTAEVILNLIFAKCNG